MWRANPPPILRNPKVKQEEDCKSSDSRRGLFRFSNMDCYLVQESDDFVVPNEYCGLDVILPSTNDWSHWGTSGFENNGLLPRKYHCNTPAKENLTNNSNSNTRMSPVEGIKVPRVQLVQKSGSSISSEDFLMTDRRMRTSDDLFRDLIDFEVQDSLQSMDEIFLDSFLDQDLTHLENLYESSDTTDAMHLQGSLRMAELEDLERLTDASTRREDSVGASQPVEMSTITESLGAAAVEGEPVCTEATALQELENVMLQLNSKTRICIRDALYRLAGRSKEERDVANVMDYWSPRSDICCGNSRSECKSLSTSEPKTNVIDRAIATLMFARPGNAAAAFGS